MVQIVNGWASNIQVIHAHHRVEWESRVTRVIDSCQWNLVAERPTGDLKANVDEQTHQPNQSQVLLDAGATMECWTDCCSSFGPLGHTELTHVPEKMWYASQDILLYWGLGSNNMWRQWTQWGGCSSVRNISCFDQTIIKNGKESSCSGQCMLHHRLLDHCISDPGPGVLCIPATSKWGGCCSCHQQGSLPCCIVVSFSAQREANGG